MRARLLIPGLPVLFLVVWFIIPLLWMIGQSVNFGSLDFAGYVNELSRPAVHRGVLSSFRFAAVSTLLTAAIGCLLLVAMASWSARSRAIIIGALMLPFVANELVRIVSWQVLLGPDGPVAATLTALFGGAPQLIGNELGIYIGLVHVQLPFFVLAAMPSVLRKDRAPERAAASLGAGPGLAQLTVTVPLALPGLLAAGILSFIIALGYYATPAVLGGTSGQTIVPALILSSISSFADWQGAAALGVIFFALSLLVILLFSQLGGMRTIYGGDTSVRGGRLAARLSGAAQSLLYLPPISRLLDALSGHRIPRAIGQVLHRLLVVAIIVYLAAPVFVAVAASFTATDLLQLPTSGLSLRWYEALLANPAWVDSIRTTLTVAVSAAVLATFFGFLVALALARGYSSVGGKFFTLFLLPMIVPVQITALGLFFMMASLGIGYSPVALVIGYTVLALPFAVIVLTPMLRSFDWDMARAAQSLGAGGFRRFIGIYLPLLLRAIAVGLFFSFVMASTELFFALLMQTPSMTTMPVMMYSGVRLQATPVVAAAAGLMVLALTATIALGSGLAWSVRRIRVRRARIAARQRGFSGGEPVRPTLYHSLAAENNA